MGRPTCFFTTKTKDVGGSNSRVEIMPEVIDLPKIREFEKYSFVYGIATGMIIGTWMTVGLYYLFEWLGF